jgi:hypothetical protein
MIDRQENRLAGRAPDSDAEAAGRGGDTGPRECAQTAPDGPGRPHVGPTRERGFAAWLAGTPATFRLSRAAFWSSMVVRGFQPMVQAVPCPGRAGSDERSEDAAGAPPEFKAKVGLEAVRGVNTINEIGHEHALRCRWRRIGSLRCGTARLASRSFHVLRRARWPAAPASQWGAPCFSLPAVAARADFRRQCRHDA